MARVVEKNATMGSGLQGRAGRRLAAAAIAGALALLGACAQDPVSEGVDPADQQPLPPQQPGTGQDPTQTGDDTAGVGTGETGGDGPGTPDAGMMDGSVGDADD